MGRVVQESKGMIRLKAQSEIQGRQWLGLDATTARAAPVEASPVH